MRFQLLSMRRDREISWPRAPDRGISRPRAPDREISRFVNCAFSALIYEAGSGDLPAKGARPGDLPVWGASIKYQVSSIKYQVSSIKYQVSSIKYQVSSIKYQVSSFKYQVSSIKYQVSSLLGAKAPTKIQEVTLMRPIHGNL